jgi:uncharacterized protein (DUF3084 family)
VNFHTFYLSHWCVQVVACQEQIQSRMASLKARMEQPIEGFAQAVAVMNQDLQNVKRSIAQQQQQQQQQRQEQEQSDGCVRSPLLTASDHRCLEGGCGPGRDDYSACLTDT